MKRGSVGEFTKVEVAEVGYTDEDGSEGVILMRAEGGREFAMRAFSGESAMHMQRFGRGDRSSIPSVFNMIEELADKEGLHLRAVEVYPAGEALRADLQFLGRGKDVVLGGYRASDAIALALLYEAPIMLHDSLLESEREEGPRS